MRTESSHRDDLYEADAIFSLDQMISERLHIHLVQSADRANSDFHLRDAMSQETCKPLK